MSWLTVFGLFPTTVVQDSRSCNVPVANSQQHISNSASFSDLSTMSACGTRSHPWRLEAPVGQRINISLLDFTDSSSSISNRDVTCHHQYGYIIEKSIKKNESICASVLTKPQRHVVVYTSTTNYVEIVLTSSATTSESDNFLLRFNGDSSFSTFTFIKCFSMVLDF